MEYISVGEVSFNFTDNISKHMLLVIFFVIDFFASRSKYFKHNSEK